MANFILQGYGDGNQTGFPVYYFNDNETVASGDSRLSNSNRTFTHSLPYAPDPASLRVSVRGFDAPSEWLSILGASVAVTLPSDDQFYTDDRVHFQGITRPIAFASSLLVDAQTLFTDAGLTPPSGPGLLRALNATLADLSLWTGLEFTAVTEARRFSGTDSEFLFLRGGASDVTLVESLDSTGTAQFTYETTQYQLTPDRGVPGSITGNEVYRYARHRWGSDWFGGGWRNCGHAGRWPCGDRNIRVTATWGIDLADYPALYQVALYRTALMAMPVVAQLTGGGLVSWQSSGKGESYGPSGQLGGFKASLMEAANSALSPYLHISI